MSDLELLETVVVGRLYTNCYILGDGSSIIVIDPGGEEGLLSERIDSYSPEEISLVATHCHFDHIKAARVLQEKYGCSAFIHTGEEGFLRASVDLSEQLFGETLELPDFTFLSGNKCCSGRLDVMHAPGHTPGSIILTSGDMMFTGDTLFRDSIGRTDFFGSDDSMRRTLSILYRISSEFRLYPGHGEETTLSREKRMNRIFLAYAGVEP